MCVDEAHVQIVHEHILNAHAGSAILTRARVHEHLFI
jgi:hypothetical protein